MEARSWWLLLSGVLLRPRLACGLLCGFVGEISCRSGVAIASKPAAVRVVTAVLFYDPLCLRPYDTQTLQQQALGGTEATVVRIADALGALVAQHNRKAAAGRYLPPTRDPSIGCVVVNRDSRALPAVRELYPNARVFLWLHDRMRPGSRRARWLASTAGLLRALDVRIICVSDTQREAVEATLRRIEVDDHVRACTIYNAVEDSLQPDGSPVDERKLVFLSSPNKGLRFALDAFREMRRRMPDLRLVVGNPGYKAGERAPIDGAEYLGPQPQRRMHTEVRTALCTFAPNFVIPETFGLVFAESKALGTPVLTFDCGAAREVIGDDRQLLPVRTGHRVYEMLLGGCPSRRRAVPARIAASIGLFDDLCDRIRLWRSGQRPVPTPDPRFRLSVVARRWREVLSL